MAVVKVVVARELVEGREDVDDGVDCLHDHGVGGVGGVGGGRSGGGSRSGSSSGSGRAGGGRGGHWGSIR